MTALLGLGANLGSPRETIESAIRCIKRLPRVSYVRGASLYVTAPVETPDAQPDYINTVCEVRCECSPQMLLGMCLGIESAHKRMRPHAKAARTLDIDLLLCADENGMVTSDSDELILPHPRIAHRAFVLAPLAELYPERSVFGWDFSSALDGCSDQRVYLLENC